MKNLIIAPIFVLFCLLLLFGNLVFKQGNYKMANVVYALATAYPLEEGAKAKYNLGNSRYKEGEYESAKGEYLNIITTTTNDDLMAKSYYNLGNTYFKIGEKQIGVNNTFVIENWLQAINEYESALSVDPYDTQSEENIEYIKALLAELGEDSDPSDNSEEQSNDSDQSDVTERNVEDIIEKEKENKYWSYNKIFHFLFLLLILTLILSRSIITNKNNIISILVNI